MKKRLSSKPAPPAAAPPPPERRQLLLVDDHPMMRAGLAALVRRQPDLDVAAEAGNPAEAMDALARHHIDLLVTDMTMPGRSGLEFIKDVIAIRPALPILVASMHDELIHAERVLRAGARGYIMKEAGGEKFIVAIRHVLAGQVYASERLAARILDGLSSHRPRGSHAPIQKLSDREFEVFQRIGRGLSVKEIAAELHLSPKTVDVHRANLRAKLGLPDLPALVHYAIRWGESAPSGAG